MIRRFLYAAVALISVVTASAKSGISKGDVNLIVASDLGRNGHYDQKDVAATMGEVAEEIGPDAVLALGDTHHYGGVQSTEDPLWMTNYELIYDHPELMVNWYPVCGNHEYRGNTQAVVDYSNVSRRWKMPARYYSKVFEEDGTTVRVVFLDTTPLIDKYHKNQTLIPTHGNRMPPSSCNGLIPPSQRLMRIGLWWLGIIPSMPSPTSRNPKGPTCRRRWILSCAATT